MNNATTTHQNYTPFLALAQAFSISEAELRESLLRCIRFLPSRFRLMLAGGKP
ncbi:MAG: hypothetical protein PHE17_16790 [Thiothrix sp.]|uniref:hypothetical protein n=1 Tax=Thiothrix sp. TaxID=1032 RepID=UPI00261E8D64|nr:hypothetical protein [Thiothrix sp.]MDD5394590.1 hypothetical protein [Thiothrix sp.]MDD5394674.1 hypothetical protein [Thiothrix sp.]